MAKLPYNKVKQSVKNMLSKYNKFIHTEFVSTWPNGRPFKHGAMKLKFQFHAKSRLAAEGDIELFMAENGYKRSEDYHIPDWNFSYAPRSTPEYVPTEIIITFATDEQFVMAKMAWGLQDEE
jgi:hypothetical protein